MFNSRVGLGAVLSLLLAGSGSADDMKPLSAEDKAKVEELLHKFDPNSYSLDLHYMDPSGRESTVRYGRAVGLANLRQTSVERTLSRAAAASTNTHNNIFKVGRAASTNTHNNIFKVASTNTHNNIFKVASTNTHNNIFKVASTNTHNNIFVDASQAAAAQELNTILQKYFTTR